MTEAQKEWLSRNPGYEPVGPPRPSVRFHSVGTLYADGEFIPSAPMKPIVLGAGCFGVGIPDDTPATTEES